MALIYLRRYLLTVILLLIVAIAGSTHNISLGTNLLYWTTATPNVSVDVEIASHWSISSAIGYNAINFLNYTTDEGVETNPKLHHYLGMAECKYWLHESHRGLYVGLHIFGGEYNVGGLKWPAFLRDTRYEGSAYGAGLSVGHKWPLSRGWNIEASLGVGYLHLDYTRYDCGACGRRLYSRTRNLIAPTKAAVTISYTFAAASPSTVSPKRNQTATPLTSVAETCAGSDSVTERTASYITSVYDPIAGPVSDTIPGTIPACTTEIPTAVHPDTLRLTLRFPVNRTGLFPDYDDNSAVISAIRKLGEAGCSIISAHITGYASPEYTNPHNNILAERRAATASRLITDILRLPSDVPVTTECGGPDWDGLSSAVPSLHVSPSADGDNLRDYRTALRSVLTTLRRAEIVIIYRP